MFFFRLLVKNIQHDRSVKKRSTKYHGTDNFEFNLKPSAIPARAFFSPPGPPCFFVQKGRAGWIIPCDRSVRWLGSFCACILLRHFPAEEHRRKMAYCSLPANYACNLCRRSLGPCPANHSPPAARSARSASPPKRSGVVMLGGEHSSPGQSGVLVPQDSIHSIPSIHSLPSPGWPIRRVFSLCVPPLET